MLAQGQNEQQLRLRQTSPGGSEKDMLRFYNYSFNWMGFVPFYTFFSTCKFTTTAQTDQRNKIIDFPEYRELLMPRYLRVCVSMLEECLWEITLHRTVCFRSLARPTKWMREIESKELIYIFFPATIKWKIFSNLRCQDLLLFPPHSPVCCRVHVCLRTAEYSWGGKFRLQNIRSLETSSSRQARTLL